MHSKLDQAIFECKNNSFQQNNNSFQQNHNAFQQNHNSFQQNNKSFQQNNNIQEKDMFDQPDDIMVKVRMARKRKSTFHEGAMSQM